MSMTTVRKLEKGEKLKFGCLYNVVFESKKMLKLLIVSEYPNFYVGVHETAYGDRYNMCINKADLICMGIQGQTILRIEEI